MAKLILIVDDEESIRQTLNGILEDEGYKTIEAENGSAALDIIQEESPDLVLLDIWMPGMDGIQTLEMIRQRFPETTAVMMSGHGTIETAVRATRIGAFDFIEKPFSLDKLLITITNALNYKELRRENEALRLAVDKEFQLIGSSQAIDGLRVQIQRVAPTTTPVLILGEEGSGKELVARCIHQASQRQGRPFISINAAAIPESILCDELFGHVRGAVPGADRQKKGRLDLVDGGTLFIDGIHELSRETQQALVTLIHDQSFVRLGGVKPVQVDVRVIAASSANLEQLRDAGVILPELYQLLQVVPLRVVPLRERLEDLPELVQHVVNEFHKREGWEPKRFDETALDCLASYRWPGNIRELKNIVERILIMAVGPVVTADDLPELLPGGSCHRRDAEQEPVDESTPLSLIEARRNFERTIIVERIESCNYDLDAAARSLDLDRTALHRKMLQYAIPPEPY